VTQVELLPCPFCGMQPVFEDPRDGNPIGAVCPEGSPCRGSKLFVCFDTDSRESAIAAWNTRSDTREQAAASPSAVGEGQPVLAYCVLYRDGTEELTWPNKDGTRDENSDEWHGEPRSITPLSSQAPKPASAGGYDLLVEARGWITKPASGHDEGMMYIDFIERLDAAIAAKTASAGGAEACLAATMVEGIDEAIANGDIERIRDIWNRRLGAIAAEADTAKEDAADVARYSADDFVAPPPSEWSPAGQRRLIEALEQHKSAPPNRLAPIEARGDFIRRLNYTSWMEGSDNGCEPPKDWQDGYRAHMRRAALRARESAPAVEAKNGDSFAKLLDDMSGSRLPFVHEYADRIRKLSATPPSVATGCAAEVTVAQAMDVIRSEMPCACHECMRLKDVFERGLDKAALSQPTRAAGET
jgi:hypothetical protein